MLDICDKAIVYVRVLGQQFSDSYFTPHSDIDDY